MGHSGCLLVEGAAEQLAIFPHVEGGLSGQEEKIIKDLWEGAD